MEITATLVKELRERSGAGMMECKKALTENKGDIDAAAGVAAQDRPRQGRQEAAAASPLRAASPPPPAATPPCWSKSTGNRLRRQDENFAGLPLRWPRPPSRPALATSRR